MAAPDYNKAQYLISAARIDQLPADVGIEVAFVGRSNAGKSSVLNRVTQNLTLARTSKTPGRTQTINLFALDEERRLVDLPGYGYAKIPPELKEQWRKLISDYLTYRKCLRGIILVMDIRHPLKVFDLEMLAWSSRSQLSVHILLNKSDKVSKSEVTQALNSVRETVSSYPGQITLQTFSAKKGLGAKGLREVLDKWFGGDEDEDEDDEENG
ncbi:MAG: ribosome biogenesis GTP-binding protein YihA/YsxC [Gammaproteobacteria bacterium]|nr:ribosome biogenesis GTP-binding protein YihA/YsxC [Gammaproteobacteria bacterium]